MSVVSKLEVLIVVAMVVSCGETAEEKDGKSEEKAETSQATFGGPSAVGNQVTFDGYVLNAFEVTVDDQPYKDLEDFYTQEIARLPAKVKTAGYDDSYTAEFDAGIGFQDLWTDMKVYVSADGKEGYQGSAAVDQDGQFSIEFPTDGNDSAYRVRANKRISVLISNGEKTDRLCYNFSAIERSVLLSDKSKPIILDSFSTSLTAYDCSQADEGGGMKIPDQMVGATSALLLRKGMTKAQVVDLFGKNDLHVNGDAWCWSPRAEPNPICAIDYASSCNCWVGFDDEGLVDSQSNIRADRLDLSTW